MNVLNLLSSVHRFIVIDIDRRLQWNNSASICFSSSRFPDTFNWKNDSSFSLVQSFTLLDMSSQLTQNEKR